jgi:hypothetical protein
MPRTTIRREGGEEIECGDVWETKGKRRGEGLDKQFERAWDLAKLNAEAAAIGAASKVAMDLDCPEECRHRLIEITTGPIDDPKCERVANFAPPPKRIWECKTKCPWKVEVMCVNMDGLSRHDRKGTIPQDGDGSPLIRCGDRYYKKGTAKGEGRNADRATAADAATKDALSTVNDGVTPGVDIARLRCRSRCPVKKVKLLLMEPTQPHCRQDKNGNWVCTVKVDFAYVAECVGEA